MQKIQETLKYKHFNQSARVLINISVFYVGMAHHANNGHGGSPRIAVSTLTVGYGQYTDYGQYTNYVIRQLTV